MHSNIIIAERLNLEIISPYSLPQFYKDTNTKNFFHGNKRRAYEHTTLPLSTLISSSGK